MPTPQELQCLSVLQAAASATVGIVLRTNNPMKARQVLYTFRRAWGSPEFADLQIRAAPGEADNTLWILRHSQAAATVEATADLI